MSSKFTEWNQSSGANDTAPSTSNKKATDEPHQSRPEFPVHFILLQSEKYGIVSLKRMEGKVPNSEIAKIKHQWETNIRPKGEPIPFGQQLQPKTGSEIRKTYEFPRWRSSDVMTASLIASKPNMQIPSDSAVPLHRQNLIEKANKKAKVDKELLHQTLKPLRSLEKKQSTSSLNIQLACNPWFDVTKLRQSIIRDSIGNIKATRDKFEQLSKNEQHPIRRNVDFYNSHDNLILSNSTTNGYQETRNGSEDHFSEVTSIISNSREDSQDSQKLTLVRNQSTTENCFTAKQQLFLFLLKKNVEFVEGLGVNIPNNVKELLQTLPQTNIHGKLEPELYQDPSSLISRNAVEHSERTKHYMDAEKASRSLINAKARKLRVMKMDFDE